MKCNNLNPIKIAVVYLGRKGGGALYSYEMAKGLIENGCEVYLFISKYAENLKHWKSLSYKNIEIVKTYKNKFSFVINSLFFRFFKYRLLKKKYKNLSIDACYFPMGHPWDPYISNALNNPQKIITVHDPIEHSSNNSNVQTLNKAVSILNKGIFNKKPDDYIILSECFFDYLVSKKSIEHNRIHIIPHCVFDFYETVRNVGYYEYDLNKTNFLFFGRIDKYKGLDVLQVAFEKFNQIHPLSTLTIVGSGDFSNYCYAYKHMPNVRIINKWIPDEEVASFFCPNKNVILVLPYIDATQSGVIPIAMSAGIPIIASNTGGLSEQIRNQYTGYLVEPNNPVALFETMEMVSKIDNSFIIENAKVYIKSLSGYELSKKIIDIINHHKQ